jgi:hypothetical protein
MTQHNQGVEQEVRFLTYRMAAVLEMPDSAYRSVLLHAIESRRQALRRYERTGGLS